ncbi:PAS domain-containing protein [Sediminicoccus sp. BL-A-41-H5]|uniref:PAS domain-containing protein n=1 Tax=Sediminicoccus sp. BL-A-41-H5 TaxID=3421106 RepID=UPI003D6770EC
MHWLRRKASALPLAIWAVIGLVLALVPAAFVQVLLEREARIERTQQLGEQAMRFVRLVGQQQSSMLEGASQLLSSMAAHDAIRAMQPDPECDAFLARIVAANPRYLTATLFDRQGQPVCVAHEAARAINVADRPHFQEVLRSNSFEIGTYSIGRATGQRSFHLAAPLRDDAGQVIGVLALSLSVDWLIRELQSIPLPPGSASTIAGRDGVVLARSLDPERFVGRMMPQIGMAVLNAPAPGIIDAPALDGVRRIAAYLPATVEPLGLFVTVGLETTALLRDAVYADRRAALMIIGSLLLTFMLAVLVFHGAVERPVRRLLATVRNWEGEDWSARVGPIAGGREFSKLAEAFDSLAESVAMREAARLRAQTRMQAVVAVAPQIVLTADQHGQVDWTNRYWEELTGLGLAESRGDGWLAAVHPEDREGAAAAWREALERVARGELEQFSREMRICNAAAGHWRWFLFTGAPIRTTAGRPAAWTAVGLDYHERRQAEADRAETAARLRATYESAPVGLCLFDRELRYIAINEMLADANGFPASAHLGQTMEAMAPEAAIEVGPILRQVLETGEPVQAVEMGSLMHGERRSWLCSYFPVRDEQGHVTGVSAAVVDITTRKRIEASERMLSREVDHRAQNVLSVVRGLVRLSAAEADDDLPALIEVLEGRIAALSRVHNVLAQERWVSAELSAILRQELAPVRGQVAMEGPALRLVADAAQPFGLVVHELVTNSMKYGALSSVAGYLTLRWHVCGQEVLLDWIEAGGPEITAPPVRIGLGSLLIDANAGAQLAGHIERRWLREGLHCVLTMGASAFAGELRPDMPARAGVLSGRRVLVADDQPERAAALVATLREARCEVIGPATSIEEALAALERARAVDAAVLPATLKGVSVQLLREALDRRAVATLNLHASGSLPRTGEASLPEPSSSAELRLALAALLGLQAAVERTVA